MILYPRGSEDVFLCPTSQQTIFPWHLPPILDVSNPRRFHWPYQILKWLRDAIRKFQNEHQETCGGCMFVLLVLYFQRLKHGPLYACQARESWIDEWTAIELDKKANHVISQGCIVDKARKEKKTKKAASSKEENEQARCKRPRKDSDQAPFTRCRTTLQQKYMDAQKYVYDWFLLCWYIPPYLVCNVLYCACDDIWEYSHDCSYKIIPHLSSMIKCFIYVVFHILLGRLNRLIRSMSTPQECRPGTRRKLPIRRSRSGSGIKKTLPGESVPNSKGTPLIVPDSDDEDNDVHQVEPVVTDDRKGGISTYAVCGTCLAYRNVEQGRQTRAISMQPLQMVMPKKSCYHTPSPGRPSFSLGLTQFEKAPTLSPIHSIHPRLRNIKKGETKEKQIRAWILNSSLNKEQHLAAYKGREHLVLQRKDLWTLKARSWVNSTFVLAHSIVHVIQWMCYSFNDTESSRFKQDFYCVCSGILKSVTQNDNLESFIDGASPVYVGLGPSFGADNRFFDKVEAIKRKWLLIPNCWRGHWWVYGFEVNAKRLVIIDILYSVSQDDERDKLDAYVGRLFEDMAIIAIPAFVRTTDGPSHSYARFMESWTEDRALDEWNGDLLKSYRMELMLDIVCGSQNALVDQVLVLLEDKVQPVWNNQPRNKKKKVRSPFTALSTRTLIERAEGLPKGRIIKGRKKKVTIYIHIEPNIWVVMSYHRFDLNMLSDDIMITGVDTRSSDSFGMHAIGSIC
ncbi:hypothetical protein Ahy_B05g078224 [Arachis hypogaea]|uniref:Ubiquitin-like protease family profile domain-containing protein n=1 Tax=Arachis hypogaea TaxID=3818 RepID=A0A444Z6L0_ARAHY|nr:hypothetical protein Ahy_B05g078224 [Arachis hypogaea]